MINEVLDMIDRFAIQNKLHRCKMKRLVLPITKLDNMCTLVYTE